ncbi:MAG: hypothetical protein Q9M22_01050 [Mariprofundaceae bacterium]|nr:hypothetical protein [Mariprofundaceae bacterium]
MHVSKRLTLPLLALAAFMLPTVATAVITAGGATIHNAATLTFAGGTVTASVDVSAVTIAAAPTITVNSVANNVSANQSFTYTYTVSNNANGADTLSFTAALANAGVTGAAALNVNGTGGISSSLVLAGSITSQASTAGIVYIPAGSEVQLAVGDQVLLGGKLYTVGAITAGTVASTTGNTTTAETATAVSLTAVGASPVITAGSVPAGTQLGEVQTFTVVVTATSPSVPGANGSHTVNLTGSTTATQTIANGGGAVTYATSAASANQTITTVLSTSVSLVKEVRNITQGAAVFASANVNAQAGDTLEYRLTATETTGASNATGNLLKDEVPAFTSYVVGSTTLNGVAVPDGAASTLPLTNANAGLQINSAGAGAGVINAGTSAVVIFRVTLN